MTKTPQQQHLDRIRRETFGLDEHGQVVAKNPLAGRLQRAIQQLSDGLNRKETHFILELIQNAEDNDYPENVPPDLTFRLLASDPTETPDACGALVLLNNETGFRKRNVEALCDVGNSTKDKRQGYIGEKGIGFKSVFVVSPRPHIFSGGYHFYFQEATDPKAGLGYIIPYPTDVPHALQSQDAATCIALPLKSGRFAEIAQELSSIAPETILFLRKLQHLSIHIDEGASFTVIRDDTTRPLVSFHDGDTPVTFWVVDKEFDVPDDLREDKREGVTTRTVTVAFSLTGDKSDGKVFAFLPTEVDSGLPFLVNADFILTTNREAIQVDRPWNQWLRDCIAKVFVEAFCTLLDHPEYKYDAYSHIPLAKEVSDPFFQPVVTAIYDLLRDRAIVWTAWTDCLVAPSIARLCPDDFRRLIDIGDELPDQLVETPLVHQKLQRFQKHLEAIGVTSLSEAELIKCLKDDQWLELQTPDWYVRLYRLLSTRRFANHVRLGGLRLVPTASENRVDSTSQPVYFDHGGGARVWTPPVYEDGFTTDFLHPDIRSSLGSQADLTQWLAEVLKVRPFTIATYYLDLIRAMSTKAYQPQTDDLVDMTRSLAVIFGAAFNDEEKAKIRRTLPLVLNDNRIVDPDPRASLTLTAPANLDPDQGWQHVFITPEDRAHLRILSDAYLAPDYEASLDGELPADRADFWRGFFAAIGATDTPPPKEVSRYYGWQNTSYEDQLFELFRARFDRAYPSSRSWPRGEGLINYRPPSWLNDLLAASEPIADREQEFRSAALLDWFEKQADTFERQRLYYRPFPHENARYFGSYSRNSLNYEHPSEFRNAVLNAPWFPTTKGLRKPTRAFLDKPELREIFGDALPYAELDVSPTVAQWLQLRQTATANEFIAYLRDDLATRSGVTTDPSLVTRIYHFLAERWSPGLREQFYQYPLIFDPKRYPHWITASKAIWPNRSAVFGDAYVYLSSYYPPTLREFFVDKVGVPDDVEPEHYARALHNLYTAYTTPAQSKEAALRRIYPALLAAVANGEIPDWWASYFSHPRIWTTHGEFSIEQGDLTTVFVPDDGEIADHCRANDIDLAWIPPNTSPAEYMPLFRAWNVPSLVETAELNAKVDQTETLSTPALITAPMKWAVCAFLWSQHRADYERLKQSDILEAFLRTSESIAGRISITYVFSFMRATAADSKAFWDRDKHILYRSASHPMHLVEIEAAATIARSLLAETPASELEHFTARVFGSDKHKVEAILHKSNWRLPDDERGWIESILYQPSLFDAQPVLDGQEAVQPEIAGQAEEGGVEGTEDALALEQALEGLQNAADALVQDAPPETPPSEQDTTTSAHEPSATGQRTAPATRPTEPPLLPQLPESNLPGAPPSPTSSQSSDPSRDAWMRSYVYHLAADPSDDEGDSDRSGGSEERAAIDKAGIAYVLAYETNAGRRPVELGHHHKGWDINSFQRTDGVESARRIEVKSTKAAWRNRGIGLTAAQFESANHYGHDYYLYVVEYALDPKRTRLYIIQDPAGKVADFRFDDSWKTIAYEP